MSYQDPSRAPRILPLEGIRGIASIAVLLNHCAAFLNYQPLAGTPFYAFMNGGAAVCLFFVLSGFVLPMPMFVTPSSSIVRPVLKRWPRLAGPCVMATVASSILFLTDAYHYQEAGMLIGSPFLSDFASAHFPANFHPSIPDGFMQGAVMTFIHGDRYYDPAIWTMRSELIGSFAVFGLAPLFALTRRPWQALILSAIVCKPLCSLEPWTMEFLVGMVLARILSLTAPVIGRGTGSLLLAGGLLALGCPSDAKGIYSPLSAFVFSDNILRILFDVGAVMVMLAVLCCASVRRVLDGKFSKWLGAISFPLYLTHTLVLCSLGCRVFVTAARLGSLEAALLAMTVTIAVSLAIASILAPIDAVWARFVSRTAALVVDAGRNRRPFRGAPTWVSAGDD